MKKFVSLLIVSLIWISSFVLFANASSLTDGTYEVPVMLMHKEDERESFGNKYIASTALLKVNGDKTTVTILLTTDMKGIKFSYYTNGSLEGDVAKGEAVSDVTVAGETYKQGFEIPVMAQGDIGLQFSVPVMPMSPSARLRIDYSNAVAVSVEETTVSETTTQEIIPETTTQAIVPETTTQVIVPETTTQVIVPETTTQVIVPETTTQVIVPETTTQVIVPETTTQVIIAETTIQITTEIVTENLITEPDEQITDVSYTEEATVAVDEIYIDDSDEKENNKPSVFFVVFFIVVAVALIFAVAVLFKKVKNK